MGRNRRSQKTSRSRSSFSKDWYICNPFLVIGLQMA
jgi:hypothetical protein